MVIEGDRDPLLKGSEGRRISAAAGPSLQLACNERGLCPVGCARVTPGYKLPCHYLIQIVHTMGQDLDNLRLCYYRALNCAQERRLRTVALSILGTSLNLKCPGEVAAQVAVEAVASWLMGAIPEGMEALKIILCANGPHAQKNLERAVTEWMSASSEGVSTLEPMAVAPLPASVGGSEEPVDREQGLGTWPLSESVLKALAQELESAVKRDPLPWYRPHPPR